MEHLAVRNFKKNNVTNKIAIAGLLSWSLAAGLSACGGGSGSGTDSGPVYGMGNGDGSGAIDLLEYMFPSSSQTQYLDEYYYSSGNFVSAYEASIARTTTLNGSRITEEEDSGFGVETIVYAITDNTISSNEDATTYRHVDIGDILFTFTFQSSTSSGIYVETEGQCSLNDQLNAFSMMNDKAEANYTTYNDVLEIRCLSTTRAYGDNTKATLHFTETDLTYSYSARNIGLIGEYDPECEKYDATLDMYYLDDMTPSDCAYSSEYIEALGPKI
jgi:hypothetical protein